jgi:hypothetical protein
VGRDRALPDPRALALIAGGGGHLAGREEDGDDWLSRLAGAVLDHVLPPIGDEIRDATATEGRPTTAPSPQEALRRVIVTACRRTRAQRAPSSSPMAAEEAWTQSGWEAAAGDLPRYIKAASDRFEARRGGEREGQGALFNALELA